MTGSQLPTVRSERMLEKDLTMLSRKSEKLYTYTRRRTVGKVNKIKFEDTSMAIFLASLASRLMPNCTLDFLA